MQKLAIGVSIGGLIVILAAVILGWIVVPNIIEDKIVEQVRLIKGSETWEKWQDIPIPVYLTFYVHHVTNPNEVEAGAKPIIVEKGPYAYKQRRYKKDLTQNEKEQPLNTVQYREVKQYFFDKERSKGKEEDKVNIVNIAFVAVVHGINKQSAALAPIIANTVLGTETLIKRDVPVGELLFKGFDASLYTESLIGGMLPEEFKGGRFGLYKGENGTKSEIYNIYTGVDKSSDFGKIKTWDGKVDLGFWKPNTTCDKLTGTDGSVFAPFFTKDRAVDVFSDDLCRSLTLTYESDIEHLGIKGYRLTVPKDVLEDPRINKENVCYCLDAKLEDCPRAGAISLEGCRDGAPIMMSTPYFLDGYEGYLNDSGLPPPKREEHITHIDVEPTTGLVLKAHKRIQVNVDVKLFPGVNAYAKLKKDIVFPLLWADESAELDKESADDLKSQLFTPKKIVNIAKWTFLGIGIVVVLAGVALYIVRRNKAMHSTA